MVKQSNRPSTLSTGLMVYRHRSIFQSCIRTFLKLSAISILYVRSWFIKDRTPFLLTVFIPGVTILFISLNKIFPDSFTFFQNCYFFIYLGIQLMAYDYLGGQISQNILMDDDPLFSVTTLIVLANSKNPIIRHISRASMSAILIGKSPMTAGGRAALIAGFLSGAGWFINSHFDRVAANNRAYLDRQAADARAAADREATIKAAKIAAKAAAKAAEKQRQFEMWKLEYQAYTEQLNRWENQSRYMRGPQPQKPTKPV